MRLPLRRTSVTSAIMLAFCACAASAQPAPDRTNADTVQTLQQEMMTDPALAAGVQALRDDPNVQAILADPAITDALNRGDIAALLANPKIQRLADDPAVKRLARQLAPSGQAPR